jgi:NitT/TauT family transport system ATP-binding protein
VNDIVLECRNVSHRFGRNKILYDINLKIARGEIVSLVGPSGCGKTTLLRAILGTHPPLQGQILMNGVAVARPGRDRGIVYQRYSLFPFLTAEKNVAFGLTLVESALWERALLFWKWWRLRRRHRSQARDLLANKFKLGHALDLYPAEMSGGMCQRVAIAQALIIKPEVLLLDEPFGALDEATREEQQNMLLDLYQENLQAKRSGRKPPYTMILVTHELNEAIYVSDRVIGLSNFWDWGAEGLEEFPGATVVYDAASPASPRDPIHRYDNFLQQREEIRRAAFEPASRTRRGQYIRFWDEFQAGRGVGVMAPDHGTGPAAVLGASHPREGKVGATEDADP